MRFLSFLFLLLALPAHAQTTCELWNNYQNFVLVSTRATAERTFLASNTKKVGEAHCFADLINKTGKHFDYLLLHFSKAQDPALLAIEDSLTLQNACLSRLEQDSSFNHLMHDWVGKTIGKTAPKDTVSVDELLQTAVKFFRILECGEYYSMRLSMRAPYGLANEQKRNPHVEAFSVASIYKHTQTKRQNILLEFSQTINRLKKVEFDRDEDERLVAAQTALSAIMYHSVTLRKILMREYEQQKAYLPFVLVGKP